MADQTALLLAEMQKLNRTVAGQGSMGAGTEIKGRGAADPPTTEAMKKRTQQEENLAKKIQKSMQKSSNAYVRSLAKSASSLEEIQKLQEKKTKESIEAFDKVRREYRANQVDLKTYRAKIKELGFTTDDVRKSTEELEHDFEQLHRTVGNLDDRMDSAAERGGKLGTAFAALKAIVVAVGTELYAVQTTSMRLGLEETANQAIQARLMGMSQVDLMETQSQYRKTMESSAMGTDEFTALMRESSHALFAFTGDLAVGAKFGAEAAQTFRNLGAEGTTMGAFITDQQDIYKDLHNVLGVTADQFKEMNEQLMQSVSVRTQLFKMDKARRTAYFVELQNVQKKLILDGLTIEQSQKVIEAMEAMGGAGPRDRLKQAAKLQAVMGGMGMGAQGAEAAALLRGGLRGEGDKARFAELMKGATAAVSERMGGGLGSEMAMQAMLEATGLQDVLGPQGAFADTVLQQGQAIAESTITREQGQMMTQNTARTTEAVLELTRVTQQIARTAQEGWIATILTSLGTIAFALGAGGLFGKLGGLLTGLTSRLGGLITTMGGKLAPLATRAVAGATTLASSAAVTGTAAVLAAGATGYAVGTGINKGWQAMDPEGHRAMSDVVGGTIAGIVDTSFGETAERTVDYWGNAFRGIWGDSDADRAAEARAAEERRLRDENTLREIADSVAAQNQLTQRQTSTIEQTAGEQTATIRTTGEQANSNQRQVLIAAKGRAPQAGPTGP